MIYFSELIGYKIRVWKIEKSIFCYKRYVWKVSNETSIKVGHSYFKNGAINDAKSYIFDNEWTNSGRDPGTLDFKRRIL